MTACPVAIRAARPTQILVHEGTWRGCALALGFRRLGLDVTLTSSGTSLPFEALSALRLWLAPGELEEMFGPLASVAGGAVKERTRNGEAQLHAARFARGVEDLLLDAGVRLAYNVRPAAVLERDGRIGGVVYGGKFGLQAIAAGCIVDASPDGRIARVADPDAGTAAGVGTLSYVLHLKGEGPWPDAKDLTGGPVERVVWHGRFAEFLVALPHGAPGPLAGSLAFAAAQRAVLAACRGMRQSGTPVAVFRGADACLPRGLPEAPAAPWPGLVAAGTGPEENILVEAAEQARRAPAGGGRWTMPLPAVPSPADGETWRFLDEAHDEPDVARLEVDAVPGGAGAVHAADLLVAGGGTSGIAAAVAAAERGVKVACLEPHGDPGGTRTAGGVSKYWFGRWPPYLRAWEADVQKSVREEGWCVAQALLDRAGRAGVIRLPGMAACGVAVRDRRVTAVFAAAPGGLVRLDAPLVVDATGDGDLAAFAGAPYGYGAGRDEATLWCSFGSFLEGRDEASRHYHTVADVRSLWDATRVMIVGRRQPGVWGEGEYPQPYLAPRESRHIRGGTTVTYLDVLRHRVPPDTVTVARSNVDIKGIAGSDAAHAGFVDRDYLGNHACGIPWRALLPEGFDNLLVTGKAYDATHDALSTARMQADMTALGAAAGIAAALGRPEPAEGRAGASPATGAGPEASFRSVDPMRLRDDLLAAGVLVATDLVGGDGPGGDESASLAYRLSVGPLPLPEQAELLALGETARRALEAVFESAGPAAEALGRMLCVLGSPAAVPALLAALVGRLNGAELPAGQASRHLAPDHGWAPEPVYLIQALAHARDTQLVPVLERIAGRLALDAARCDHRFDYVHAIAYALERLADPAEAQVLRTLLADPAIRERTLPRGADPRLNTDERLERFAYLELCLARALARCGEPDGYRVLARITGDQRLFLARSARRELAELSGEDRGFDPAAWLSWLSAQPPQLPPHPYLLRQD